MSGGDMEVHHLAGDAEAAGEGGGVGELFTSPRKCGVVGTPNSTSSEARWP
jgi:hypothetical protein